MLDNFGRLLGINRVKLKATEYIAETKTDPALEKPYRDSHRCKVGSLGTTDVSGGVQRQQEMAASLTSTSQSPQPRRLPELPRCCSFTSHDASSSPSPVVKRLEVWVWRKARAVGVRHG